jgi:hypothetical protein
LLKIFSTAGPTHWLAGPKDVDGRDWLSSLPILGVSGWGLKGLPLPRANPFSVASLKPNEFDEEDESFSLSTDGDVSFFGTFFPYAI